MIPLEKHIIKGIRLGNVTQVTSSCPWLQNHTFSETFTYDASDQLTSATESQSQSYQLAVTYGNWGKINSYNLTQTDLQSNTSQSESQSYTYPATNSIGSSQTLFAPVSRTIQGGQHPHSVQSFTFGINGSLRKREIQFPVSSQNTEYYLFNSAANLKAYSNNGLDFAYYGYNSSNARTYKLSMQNMGQWVNGQPEPIHLQLQSAMFYPNAYINFNQNGEYTKHYYNGAERIASRLGTVTLNNATTSNARLDTRSIQLEDRFRNDIRTLVYAGNIPMDLPPEPVSATLQTTGTSSDIFYYHTNHLGSTAFVTDQNRNVTQGFLYAPFGEITTEYNANFYNNVLPKYSFNAKELDEETGMYYYEARYYKPPVFTSRDRLFEKYSWTSPYGYCMNNPIKFVDPSGDSLVLLNNRTIATKIINDLNAIYKAKYNVDNAFYLNEYKKDGKNCYRIGASENFDWNKDEYTKAMKECIDDPVKVYIKMVPNNNPEKPTLGRGRKVNDFVKDLGGGSTEGKYVYLSDALPTYASLENKKTEHCLGGITLHEILYHLHKVGVQDDKAVSTGGSELMQMHYGLKISRPHGSGSQHCFPSKPKLNSKKL